MSENPIQQRGVTDFLTVCAEYCKTLEQCGNDEREHFIDVMRGLLAMLYLKASLLPDFPEEPGYNEPVVTEDDYEYIRTKVAAVMKEQDDYLDVFMEDFKYSDQPILCTVSENLADIYQNLRNFVEVVRGGHEEAVSVALYDIRSSFETEWGQKVLNALRALHDARFGMKYETV